MANPSKPETLSRSVIYQSPWVNLYVDRVRFPNGSIIERHHLLDFEHHAVMAIVNDQENRFLMVKVPRYTTGRAEWEFPAGRIETGEEIISAAQREVLEETGYRSTDYRMIYSYYPLNGIANQVFHILCCRSLDLNAEIDTQEVTGVRWFTAQEIWQMIQAGEIKDGYTLTSFLLSQRL